MDKSVAVGARRRAALDDGPAIGFYLEPLDFVGGPFVEDFAWELSCEQRHLAFMQVCHFIYNFCGSLRYSRAVWSRGSGFVAGFEDPFLDVHPEVAIRADDGAGLDFGGKASSAIEKIAAWKVAGDIREPVTVKAAA